MNKTQQNLASIARKRAKAYAAYGGFAVAAPPAQRPQVNLAHGIALLEAMPTDPLLNEALRHIKAAAAEIDRRGKAKTQRNKAMAAWRRM